MQRVLFEGTGQAGTGSRGHTCLAAVKALAQQFVSVRPVEVSHFVLDILALALVVRSHHHLAEDWILHRDAAEAPDVGSRRLIVFVGQTVRVRIVGGLEAEGARVAIHFLQEVLHRLVALQAALVLVKGPARATVSYRLVLLLGLLLLRILVRFEPGRNFKQVLTEMLSQSHGRVIATREHEPVQ